MKEGECMGPSEREKGTDTGTGGTELPNYHFAMIFGPSWRNLPLSTTLAASWTTWLRAAEPVLSHKHLVIPTSCQLLRVVN